VIVIENLPFEIHRFYLWQKPPSALPIKKEISDAIEIARFAVVRRFPETGALLADRNWIASR
jgi:hypothetical protein